MLDIDLGSLFAPQGSLAEIAVRGTVIYLTLFIVIRFIPRRAIGSMGASDILVIVLISETVSNSLQGGAQSITEGLFLAAVIVGWATLIDHLDYKFPHWQLTSASPLEMIRNGRLMRRNMAREQVTEEEVMSQLRQHGLASAKDVVVAYLEGDGHFSVMVRSGAPIQPPADRRA